jgi:hypothetical protein
MEYNKLIAVTGLPGLFEMLSSKTDGAIVRSLDDKSTRFVSSRQHNFSHLESIEVYTTRENVNLVDVFQAMEKNGDSLPSDKDANAVKSYFQKVYPDMDFERVYSSDMKKMVKWFGILKANEVEIKLTEAPAAGETTPEIEATSTEAAETVTEEKPVKKARAKKAAPADETAATEEKPKKTTTRKKKTEE